MAVQGYYDFINHAYSEGEDSDFVKGLAALKTPGKRLREAKRRRCWRGLTAAGESTRLARSTM